MPTSRIGLAVENTETHYRNQDDPGPREDMPATARIEAGLRCRIEADDGGAIYTDMPVAVGGGASANSPGWHLRAALASCDATLLAMRAARLGLQLERIEVRVEASSDGRGMFLDEGINPGSTDMRLLFRIGRGNASVEQVHELVHWVEEHSPVGNDVTRAVSVASEIEVN
jgi:uncharacterized OsmC-like protein